MILYKNVDIKDLESILSKGILSLNKSGNNNWDNGKRAENSCDVVYMFIPLTKENSFCKYGVALLEIDIPDEEVTENQMSNLDTHIGKYIEYITNEVSPNHIMHVYIPEIFKERAELPAGVTSKVTWCNMKANYWGENEKEDCPIEVLKQFAQTAEIMDSSEFNFFRGVTEKRTMIDLYDIQYICDKQDN